MARLNNPDRPPDKGKIKLPSVDAAMNKIAPQGLGGGKGGKDDKKDLALGSTQPKKQKILERAIKRFDRIITAEADGRKAGLEDLKFLAGDQWPAGEKSRRETDKRPCLTINKLPSFVNQVTNDLRQNRPTIMVAPVGDKGDKEVAQMYRGLIRSIERDSSADIAYDTGATSAARIGVGYWRILTEPEEPDSFDQVVVIRRIRNAFTVYLDPDHQEPDGADAKYAFISEEIPRSEFDDAYPDADPVQWTSSGVGDAKKNWVSQNTVRIAEYFEVGEKKRELVGLSNGFVGWRDKIDDATKELMQSGDITLEKSEMRSERNVTWFKMTGTEILEELPWQGRWIPIVKIIGDEIDIEGKVQYSGIVRNAKDPQRMVNYWESAYTEMVALQPKNPYIMEEGQVEGHEDYWKQANVKNYPYLLYKGVNVSGKPAPPPARQPMAGVPAGIQQAIANNAQNMMATTGIRFDATKNERMMDESGVAIKELRRSGDIGSFHYVDNMARSLRHTGRILIDLIPKVYDTKRMITILREDDTEEQVQMDPNSPKPYMERRPQMGQPGMSAVGPGDGTQQKMLKIFNPTYGRYGVTVTIGPSYATKRIEASENMMAFAKAMPNVASLIADLIAKNQDWPGAEEMAKRLAKAVPAQLMTPDQKDVPPQVQAVMNNLDQQVKQLTQERQQLLAALNEKQTDRAQRQDEINKAFEAKMAAVEEKFAVALMQLTAKAQEGAQGQENEATKLMLEHLARINEGIEKANERAEQQREEATGLSTRIDGMTKRHDEAMQGLSKRDAELAERMQETHKSHKEELGELRKAMAKPKKITVAKRDPKTGRASEIVAE